MLQIRCKNNNVTKSFPEGCSLMDVYQEFQDEIQLPYPVVSAKESLLDSTQTGFPIKSGRKTRSHETKQLSQSMIAYMSFLFNLAVNGCHFSLKYELVFRMNFDWFEVWVGRHKTQISLVFS